MGTGSGCIALALAHRLPDARIYAVDTSAEALAVARENAESLGLAGRVVWCEGRFPEIAEGIPRSEIDVVVSNPPYVPSAEIEQLDPEVRDHEPRLALDGGDDGLDVVRVLVSEAPSLLRRGGILAMEIGAGQSEAVRALIQGSGAWVGVEILPDLAGIPRVVVARKGMA